jgi:hypothetical protein
MAKNMNGIQDRPSARSLIAKDKILISNEDKANAFASYFANISSDKNHSPNFLLHKRDIETNKRDLFSNDVPLYDETSPLNKNFTLFELENAIASLKNDSAPGKDAIPYEVYKNLPTSSRRVLLKCFNGIWSTSRIFQPNGKMQLYYLSSNKERIPKA